MHTDDVTTPVNTLPEKLPVPMYETFSVEHFTSRTNDLFTVRIGLDKELIDQLKTYSLDTSDTDLQENTSDYERFGKGSYEEWYAKGRTPFALVHEKTGALAALVWFGPKPLGRKSLKHLSVEEREREGKVQEDVWHTIVFRAYHPFRGQGLMTSFAKMAIQTYKKYFPHAKLWAGINATNAGSIALAEKLGFVRESSLSDEKWTAMIEGDAS